MSSIQWCYLSNICYLQYLHSRMPSLHQSVMYTSLKDFYNGVGIVIALFAVLTVCTTDAVCKLHDVTKP